MHKDRYAIMKFNKLNESKEEMTLEQFADRIRVSGPSYRGAAYPEFNEFAINISKIPDNMRPKYYQIDAENDAVYLDWVTQEEFSLKDKEQFLQEIKRAVEALINHYSFTLPFSVEINAECRAGREYGILVTNLDFNSTPSELEEEMDDETLHEGNEQGDYRIISTGLTSDKDQEVLDSVIGQLSDGIWENSPAMEKYWRTLDIVKENGTLCFKVVGQGYVDKRFDPNGRNRSRYIDSPWRGKSDEEVLKWFAQKVKQVVKTEITYGSSAKWDRNDTTELDYMSSGITVKDAYKVYDALLKRKPRITDECLDEDIQVTHWTEAYKFFENIVNEYFPDLEEIESQVYNLYMSHQGEKPWEDAYERWCDGAEDSDMDECLDENIPTNDSDSSVGKEEDIEFVMSEYIPDSMLIDFVKKIEKNKYLVGVADEAVTVEFDPNWSEYVYTINGKGPYSHRSYEYISRDVYDFIMTPKSTEEVLQEDSINDHPYYVIGKNKDYYINEIDKIYHDESENEAVIDYIRDRITALVKQKGGTGGDLTVLSGETLFNLLRDIKDYKKQLTEASSNDIKSKPEYCPHCSNLSLKGVGDGCSICDSCGSEYQVSYEEDKCIKTPVKECIEEDLEFVDNRKASILSNDPIDDPGFDEYDLEDKYSEYDDDYYDLDEVEQDRIHAALYGGDREYCSDCGAKLAWDEGYAYCPVCNESMNTLPTTLNIDSEDLDDGFENIEDAISEYLSDSYGYCHLGFNYKMENGIIKVFNIEWDMSECLNQLKENCNVYVDEIVSAQGGRNETERHCFATVDKLKHYVKEAGLSKEDIDSINGCDIKDLFPED